MLELMTLNARVTQLTSGANQADKKPRCRLQVDGADFGYNQLSVINDSGLVLDQPMKVSISQAEAFDRALGINEYEK
jgi:hypothetical protein